MMSLNIVAGESAAERIRALLEPNREQVLALFDHLAVGPLTRVVSLDSWGTARRAFWRQVQPDLCPTEDELTLDAPLLRSAEAITLWIGTGLGDQLALAWFAQVVRILEIPLRHLR